MWTLIEVNIKDNEFKMESHKMKEEDSLRAQFVAAIEYLEAKGKMYNRCEMNKVEFHHLAEEVSPIFNHPVDDIKKLKELVFVFNRAEDKLVITPLEGHTEKTLLFYNFVESLKYEM